MTGSMDANMKLSQARAESVVQALVSQHGVAAARLSGATASDPSRPWPPTTRKTGARRTAGWKNS